MRHIWISTFKPISDQQIVSIHECAQKRNLVCADGLSNGISMRDWKWFPDIPVRNIVPYIDMQLAPSDSLLKQQEPPLKALKIEARLTISLHWRPPKESASYSLPLSFLKGYEKGSV